MRVGICEMANPRGKVMHFCEDCMHADMSRAFDFCNHPESVLEVKQDPVRRETVTQQLTCDRARRDGEKCGPEGKLFFPK